MTQIRTRQRDTESENEVARLMETAWQCEVHRTGYLDTWDFVGTKEGRTVFIAELKTRDVTSTTYDTVFLSAHKWLALAHASAAMNISAIFIVRFKDAILYQPIKNIDATQHRMAGRNDRTGAPNDKELIIDVPVYEMRQLGKPTT
jgi:hypothetical protein